MQSNIFIRFVTLHPFQHQFTTTNRISLLYSLLGCSLTSISNDDRGGARSVNKRRCLKVPPSSCECCRESKWRRDSDGTSVTRSYRVVEIAAIAAVAAKGGIQPTTSVIAVRAIAVGAADASAAISLSCVIAGAAAVGATRASAPICVWLGWTCCQRLAESACVKDTRSHVRSSRPVVEPQRDCRT